MAELADRHRATVFHDQRVGAFARGVQLLDIANELSDDMAVMAQE